MLAVVRPTRSQTRNPCCHAQAHHFLQVCSLEAVIAATTIEKAELQATIDRMKTEAADLAKKDTLKYQILLDMFGLQLLQTSNAAEVEAMAKAPPGVKAA
jgi:arsenate reductase-like glutaredoxin family protein